MLTAAVEPDLRAQQKCVRAVAQSVEITLEDRKGGNVGASGGGIAASLFCVVKEPIMPSN